MSIRNTRITEYFHTTRSTPTGLHTTNHCTQSSGSPNQHQDSQPLNRLYDWICTSKSSHAESSIISMAFQNVHGLHTRSQSLEESLADIITNMETFEVHVMGLSEHHLAISNLQTRQKLYETLQRLRPGRISHQFNSGPETDPYGYLRGGTGLLLRDEITGRLVSGGRGGDEMGRWSYCHLRRQHRPPITVISIYQVCKSPTNKIGDTAWHQQRRYLDLHNRDDHPRTAFIKDLQTLITTMKQKNHAIIVGGDWNEWIGHNKSSLSTLCNNSDLVDPWLLQSPSEMDFPTYEFGQHRIDSILISTDLLPAVQGMRYSPVGLLCTTDHRAVIIDFKIKTLFGNASSPMPPLAQRSLRSNDKISVTTFIEAMHNHLLQQNAFAKGHRLMSDDQVAANSVVEQLDTQVGEAGNIGEKKCRRRRRPWYSSILARLRYTVSLLRHYVNGLKRKIDRSSTIVLRLGQISENIDLPLDLSGARKLLAEYETKLALCVQDSANIRQKELAARAQTAKNGGHTTKSHIHLRINAKEKNQQTWQTLKFATTPGRTHTLDRIDIPASWPPMTNDLSRVPLAALEDPKNAHEWRTVTDPHEIEYYLTIRNYQHFGQAQGTPFTVPPLSHDFDWTATSPAANEVLHEPQLTRHYNTSLCNLLLQQCRYDSTLPGIPSLLSARDFEGKLKVWRESTTTSPSGRHLGRYKALFASSIYDSTSDNYQRFCQQQIDIRTLILQIINYCIATGYTLQRWRQVINTMIFKEDQNYKVHKLRVIHIFEADLNLLYAVKWRQMIRQMDQHNQIHQGQYGGRPGYEAQSMALLEELRTEASYLTRRSLLTFDNDAASCYDRIVINLASLINRKYGLPPDITRLHGRILQQTQYRVKTPHGVSSLSYSNSSNIPLYGTGQGAGNSPGVWLAISNVLFNTFDTRSHGASFVSRDGTITTTMGLCGFVDDTNSVINDFRPQTECALDLLLQFLREDAQLWTDLLHVSGGKLELSKCSFHALSFRFQPNGTPTVLGNDTVAPLSLHDPGSETEQLIQSLPPTQAHKILGHWKAPADPRQQQQLQSLLQKAERIATIISASPITRQGASLAYFGKYIPGLRYVLPQCWFPLRTLHQAQRKSMAKIIAKCGYAITTPHALIYAPREYGGAGFISWASVQSEGQILLFIKHWRTSTTVSNMLRICVSWAQWQAGTSVSLLADATMRLPQVEGRWLQSLRQALAYSHSHLQLDQDFIPEIERLNDRYIMDIAMESGEFNADDLRLLNYCRLYLHVVTVSDITDATGSYIMPEMFDCIRPRWFNPTTITVLQQRPSRFQCHFQWKRLCRIISNHQLLLGEDYRLSKWLVPTPKLRLRREAYLNTSDNTLYIWRIDTYWRAMPHPEIPHHYTMSNTTDWMPTTQWIPAPKVLFSSPVLCRITAPLPRNIIYRQPRTLPGRDFTEYKTTLPAWTAAYLENITWHQQPYEIRQYLLSPATSKVLYLVTSSATLDTLMVGGAVLGDADGHCLVEVVGPGSGSNNSYRAACNGCLSGVALLHYILTFTATTLPSELSMTIFSTSRRLINALTRRQAYVVPYANETLVPEWDVLEQIYQMCNDFLRTKPTYQTISGTHNRTLLEVLSPEAKYQITAADLVHNYIYNTSPTPAATTYLLPCTRVLLFTSGIPTTTNYQPMLRASIAAVTYQQYMCDRHTWTTETFKDVDWDIFRSAARTYKTTEVAFMKLIHDKLPTNHLKAKYSHLISEQCHFCEEPETFHHLCTANCNSRSIDFRAQLLQAIKHHFSKYKVVNPFRKLYLSAIHRCFQPTDSQMDLSKLFVWSSQDKIGWFMMFKGFLSKEWRRLLQRSCSAAHNSQWLQRQTISPPGHVPTAGPVLPLMDTKRRFKFFIHLQHIIWENMTNLWLRHLKAIHGDKPQSNPSYRQELVAQIYDLHRMRPLTLAAHRDSYFHESVEEYTEKATNIQMQRYIQRYRPAVLNSLRTAQRHITTTLSIRRFFPPRQTNTQTPRTQHEEEEHRHRKHTRIRPMPNSRITQFFTAHQAHTP